MLPKWAAPPNVYYRKLVQSLNFASSGLLCNRFCGKQKKNNLSVLKCVLYDLVWVRNDVCSTAYVLMMMDDDDDRIHFHNDAKERNPKDNGYCAVRVACTELYRVHKSSRTLVKLLVACMDLVLDVGDGGGVSWKIAVQRLYDVFCSMLEMLVAGTVEEVESLCKYMIQYVLLRQRQKQGNEAVVGSSTKTDDPPLLAHACALHWLLGKVKVLDSQPSGTDAYKSLPLLQHAFQYAATQWHSNAFIRYSCPAFQRNLTAFILRYLEQADASSSDDSVPSAQINANNDVSALLVRGISHRLHSIDISIRRDGMFVAELLAKITLTKEQQQSNVVSFDELLDVPRWSFSNFDCDDTIADALHKDGDNNYKERKGESMFSSSVMESEKSRSSNNKNNFLVIDPDQAYHSSSDDDSHSDGLSCSLSSSSSDSDSFDETDLHSFQGEDDVEDLRTVPKPLYLRQCLLMLRESSTNENDECAYAKMKTALIELPILLERRRRQLTDDLRDVCQLLCKELMNVENKYNIEHFDALRFKSLVQLIVSEPILSARCLLGDILFEEGGITLGRRIELLNVLMCAAKELSNVGQSETDIDKLENCNTHELVKEQVGKVIRRRRIRKREAVNSNSSNKFAPHAVFFVFSLLRGFANSKENRSIWDNGDDDGCQMICTFLYTLGTLIECSGKGLSTPKLAVEVFQFSLLFRLADRPHVRQAVLYSLYICIQHVDEEFLFDVVHSNFDIVRYLTHSSSSDPNEKC